MKVSLFKSLKWPFINVILYYLHVQFKIYILSRFEVNYKCGLAAGRSEPSGGASSSSAGRGSSGSSGSLPQTRPGETRECYYGVSQPYSCKILAQNTTLQECCCTAGQGWGLMCQYDICPEMGTGEQTHPCTDESGLGNNKYTLAHCDVVITEMVYFKIIYLSVNESVLF